MLLTTPAKQSFLAWDRSKYLSPILQVKLLKSFSVSSLSTKNSISSWDYVVQVCAECTQKKPSAEQDFLMHKYL